jgi:hypothetical protein
LIHAVNPAVLQPLTQPILETLINTLDQRIILSNLLPLPRFIQYLFEGFGMSYSEE